MNVVLRLMAEKGAMNNVVVDWILFAATLTFSTRARVLTSGCWWPLNGVLRDR